MTQHKAKADESRKKHELKGQMHHNFFCNDLHSGGVNASSQNQSADFGLSDFTDNRVVYDSNRLRLFSFSPSVFYLYECKKD